MSIDESVRTAVVFVHGLLERRPMDVLDLLAKTALTPDGDRWEYTPAADGDHGLVRGAPLRRAVGRRSL